MMFYRHSTNHPRISLSAGSSKPIDQLWMKWTVTPGKRRLFVKDPISERGYLRINLLFTMDIFRDHINHGCIYELPYYLVKVFTTQCTK